jgi:hypothetical protein
MTHPPPHAHAGRGFGPQLCNQPQNLPEHLPRNGDLGHLEGDDAAIADDLGTILISFSFRLDSDQSLIGSAVNLDAKPEAINGHARPGNVLMFLDQKRVFLGFSQPEND